MNFVSFFTATILNWNHLLSNDKYKDIITGSMNFLVKDERVNIYAFVIMPNHIHIIWKLKSEVIQENLQRDFLKFTAQNIKLELQRDNPQFLREFYVGAKDREYQIWERNPMTSRLPTVEIIEQKVSYVHLNPIRRKWKLAEEFFDYKYSSAKFYYTGKDNWGFLTHYMCADAE